MAAGAQSPEQSPLLGPLEAVVGFQGRANQALEATLSLHGSTGQSVHLFQGVSPVFLPSSALFMASGIARSFMNILILEDNEQMRRAIKTCLADVTEEIFECTDGDAALFTYGRYRPDWVLVDLEMTGLSGFEATRQIKLAYPEAQIVVFTNYDGGDLRVAAKEAGACAFIVKENLIAVREILVKSGVP
jgi:CheY-like chemotaxis protein